MLIESLAYMGCFYEMEVERPMKMIEKMYGKRKIRNLLKKKSTKKKK